VKRKILAAFFLALVAVIVAVTITHFSFSEMMGTVDELSAPNEKLSRLNKVFEEITTLDQQQRAEAIENPEKPYKYFLDQAGFLHYMIDSLQMLPWDAVQLKRLRSLHAILDKRNELFVSYLKVKAELANNREFSSQLDTLSLLLKENQQGIDSSVITTEKKVITTYLSDSAQVNKDERGFLKKLFSKKKPKPAATKRPPTVEEQLNVKIDTLAVARQGINLVEIQRIITELEKDQRSQRSKLQRKELELINANSLFINQLLNTLHEVQNEELQVIRATNAHASQVVTQGINRMNLLVITFFLAAAVLVFFILVDISRSNYYKKQLEKARDQAEELSKIKQRFLANMSHEIRTPLQSIIGFAEQLKFGSQNKDSVEAIYSSSEHLLQIVNEVLDYSRISSGTFTLASENFRLRHVISEVEAAMRIQATNKKLDLIVNTEHAADVTLNGDPFRLRQILYNLIGNAVKFTYRGFIRMDVKTIEEKEKVIVTFEITDSGIGMSKDEVDKIFNQFEQANSDISKKYGGTGLGLTIVKALVDVQHGRIEVSSEPGAGSTFLVTLSFQKNDNDDHPEAVEHRQHTEFKSKVVVVDDDVMILRLCDLILKKNNIRHTIYSQVGDLIEQEPDPSVSHFFIDIRMPQVNGIQLCKTLKPKYNRETKFIALTAHVLPEERQSLLNDGFDVVLTKPFHEATLLDTLGIRSSFDTTDYLPDFSIVRQMTMGDESLFQSVLQQFVDESESDLHKLRVATENADKKNVREIIHKLAGRFGQIGIQDLSEKFRELELDLVDGRPLSDIQNEIANATKESLFTLHAIRVNTLAQQLS
jgi:signal transduction histidine kinase/HPt (histidine-containing phosphotransfer) domain-containing protein